MNRLLTIAVLLGGLMVALPLSAADGNIYLTGHDLDFHCAFQPTPTQCNAFKIALTLARAGAPDPGKKVLFLDEGMSDAAAAAHGFPTGEPRTYQLALAAAKIGLPSSAYEVVDPASTAFSGNHEDISPLPITTSTYSAIVIASDVSCGSESAAGQCDNTEAGESNINERSADIATFFAAGGGLVYLSGADSSIYYGSVPTAYAVESTSSTSPFTVTPAGKSLGLTNDDANCCATHNSFVAPIVITAPTLDSASNPKLISAEIDQAGKDETLYAVGASTGGQAAVLTFTPGHPSQVATFNCSSNVTPCPDDNAHSMKVSVGAVNTSFTIVLTATEVQGNGICESGNPNDATDYDCRFTKFFGQSASPAANNKVPLCYPYSNGNCVFYDISGAPPRSAYTSPVLEYIAWNNVVTPPSGYLGTPHMYDDPSDDANACNCYPTTTPGFPYTPEDNQYVFDITTLYKDEGMQVGKDPGTGGRTVTFNQFGIAFPLSSGDSYKWISPLSTNSNTTTVKRGSTLPVKFQLRDSSGSSVSNAVVPPNFVRIAVLDNNGASQPVLGTGAFIYDPTKQQYQFNLATSPYAAGITFTIVVNSNLFPQQIAKFKTSK